MADIEIPLPLKNSLLSGKCVLFVGAGAGGCSTGADGKPLPDAARLARELLRDFGLSEFESENLPAVAQLVELRKGRKELDAYISKRFSGVTPDEHIRWITTVPWKAIFTTNYDDAIEKAYSTASQIRQTPLTISSTSDVVDWHPQINVPVFHLHGVATSAERSRIIITEDDYVRYNARRRMLFELLKQNFATSTILYLGYSNRDPNWRELHASVVEEFLPAVPPVAYRVILAPDPLEGEILTHRGVHTIAASVEDFVDAAATLTATATFDPDHLESLRRGVPRDLLKAFEESPAPTARLLQNWAYLNQQEMDGRPNTKDFLQGNVANWSLIAAGNYFRRDTEDIVFDDLLDFATSARSTTSVSVVLGPAGYASQRY